MISKDCKLNSCETCICKGHCPCPCHNPKSEHKIIPDRETTQEDFYKEIKDEQEYNTKCPCGKEAEVLRPTIDKSKRQVCGECFNKEQECKHTYDEDCKLGLHNMCVEQEVPEIIKEFRKEWVAMNQNDVERFILESYQAGEEEGKRKERLFILNILDGIDLADNSMENKGGGTLAIRHALKSRIIYPS